jgi:hypothetical protein
VKSGLLPTKEWFRICDLSFEGDLPDYGHIETLETLKPRWAHNLEVTRAQSSGLRATRSRNVQDAIFLCRVRDQPSRIDTCSERFDRLYRAGYISRNGLDGLSLTASGKRHLTFLRGAVSQ